MTLRCGVPAGCGPKYARIGVYINAPRRCLTTAVAADLIGQTDMSNATCSIDGCDRPVKVKKYGWCSIHYSRWNDHGDPLADVSRRRLGQCSTEGCAEPAKAQNLCTKHYTRLLRYGSSEVIHPPGTPARQTTCEAGEECDGKPLAKGLCPKHYARWRTHGTPIPARLTVLDRFWTKVDKHGPISAHRPDLGPCWEWTAAKSKGYGRFSVGGRLVQAHRFSFMILAGPVSDDLELDHLCRNRACVNPAHLEPVTHKVNTIRGVSPFAVHAAQTYCDSGHEFTPENTMWRSRAEGGRACRECNRIQLRARRESYR